MQDQCVANFMGEPKIIAPLIFLFSFIGLLFIFPFIMYVILYFIKKKVYCDNWVNINIFTSYVYVKKNYPKIDKHY